MALVWLIHICIIIWLMLRFRLSWRNSPVIGYFWYGIAAKIIGGALFGLYYQFFGQGGDTWSFFESSKIMAYWGTTNPWHYIKSLAGGPVPDSLLKEIGFAGQPRALFMVKIVSVFSLATGNSFWLTSCYFSLFSFSGMWTLADRVAKSYPGSGKAAMAAFIFLPTAIFWGSGISKEAIFMGGFGFLTAWFWPWFRHESGVRIIKWLSGLVMLLILFQLKYYYVAVLIPVLLSTVLQSKIVKDDTSVVLVHSIWLLMFVTLLFLASWFHPNLRLDHLANLVINNAGELFMNSSSSALIHFRDHTYPLKWMVINFPWAVFSGLLRPNLGDWGTIFQNLAVVEHLVISIFLFGKTLSVLKWNFKQPDWLPCVIYILILSGLLTLSTPNFGTLVRFKVSYLPVFMFLVLYRNRWWDQLVYKFP